MARDADVSTSQLVGAQLHQRRRLTGEEAPFFQQHAPGPCKIAPRAASNFYIVSRKFCVTDAAYTYWSKMREDRHSDLMGGHHQRAGAVGGACAAEWRGRPRQRSEAREKP